MDTLHIDGFTEAYVERSNHADDAGLDLVAPTDIMVPPHEMATIDFGIRCRRSGSGGYYLYPRSSISKTPLRLANSVGIIDAGYRGNIMAKVDNISDEPYIIKKGDRLFQICMPDLRPFNVVLGNVAVDTARGAGGYGSTGSC
jgi:dUTP pyrophosphatase